MINSVFLWPSVALAVMAILTFAAPATAQDGDGLNTAREALTRGTTTPGDIIDGLFGKTPDQANAGLDRAATSSATGGAVATDRIIRLESGERALGHPLVLLPGQGNGDGGRPAGVGNGPPISVTGGRSDNAGGGRRDIVGGGRPAGVGNGRAGRGGGQPTGRGGGRRN